MADGDLAGRARRLIEEGFGRGDPAILDELMSPDIVEHQRGNGQGIEGAKGVVATLHRWMSDFELTVQDLAVAGDIVWTRNRASGSNTGAVMGHPATGASIEIDVFDVMRFENGRAVEHWGVADQLGMMLQLGIAPVPGGSGPRPA